MTQTMLTHLSFPYLVPVMTLYPFCYSSICIPRLRYDSVPKIVSA